MEFSKLTRKHGVRIAPAFVCSVEDCSLSVGKVVGYSSIKSAARMNNAVVIFVDTIEKANTLVEKGITINDAFVSVLPLATPAKKVTLANVPPFISDEVLARELSRYGKIVSQIRKIPSGCKSPELKHVVSHRRYVFMILNKRDEDLSLALKLRVDDFDYIIFATSASMKCYRCGKEGHLIRACPEKEVPSEQNVPDKTADETNQKETETVRQDIQDNVVRQDETGEMQQGSQVKEGGQEKTGEVQKDSEVSEGGLKKTDKVQKNSKVGEGGQENITKGQEASPKMMFGPKSMVTAKQNEKTVNETAVDDIVSGEGEINMKDDEGVLKVSHMKRKIQSNSESSRAKRSVEKNKSSVKVVEQKDTESDSSMEEDCDADSVFSDSKMTASQRKEEYSIGKIKLFLQKTKNMKGVKVEDFFSDRDSFSYSVRQNMGKKGKGVFTKQEEYRLKKIVQKIRPETNSDDDD